MRLSCSKIASFPQNSGTGFAISSRAVVTEITSGEGAECRRSGSHQRAYFRWRPVEHPASAPRLRSKPHLACSGGVGADRVRRRRFGAVLETRLWLCA